MKTVTVALGNENAGDRSYQIHIGEGVRERLRELLAASRVSGRMALVTDSNVGPLYARGVAEQLAEDTVVCTLPAGEENKRLDQIEWLCGRFLEARLDRSSVVVALGGGVTGDMAGFAASIFMRGIPFVQIPTTIVAQVDSSVGGKTGVNHALGKNTLGAFHQPSAVFIDMQFLTTLPDRELRAGMAEVIKHGVIADADLFQYLEQNAVRILAKDLSAIEYPVVRSCEIKSDVVSQDEREQGVRANLNYGHTFGHGFEGVTHYTYFLHGEAVALGMHAAALLAVRLGMITKDIAERQRLCIEAFGLPTRWPELPVQETIEYMRRDKKVRAGTMTFVLPDALGHVVRRKDITEQQLAEVLEVLRTQS